MCVARISRLAISIVLIALGVTQTAPVEVNAAGGKLVQQQLAITESHHHRRHQGQQRPTYRFPRPRQPLLRRQPGGQRPSRRRRHSLPPLAAPPSLSHEIERYGSATGALVAWVKVPSLPSATDTVLFMYYSNGSATSQQDATNVWDSNYKAVWHLKENAAAALAERLLGLDFQCQAWAGLIAPPGVPLAATR